jgi:hypothetical protein
MENIILAEIPMECVFLTTAVIYLVCSSVIVCLIKNLGSKLILLGSLTATAGLVFAATMPSVKALAWLVVLAALFLIFYGATKYNQ